jgi:hypothetical protein
VVAAYLHHFNDHTNSVSGELTLNVPGDPSSSQTLVGSWINPSTGNVLSTVQVAPGQQTIAVPSFTVDVAFIATPSITSSGSPG